MEEQEVETKSGWKLFLSLIFILISISLLAVYWFIPFNTINFGVSNTNSNFSLIDSKAGMQFYENMRFPEPRISYKIYDCPLQKKNDMEIGFEILENKTSLEFYEVGFNPEISITCDSKNKFSEGLFVAGEGGPTNITKTSNFNVILSGKILLIRDSPCKTPNVAIHELLHVLGFDHSTNKNNIMYNISKCGQTIGDDTIDLINELYSVESLPDLTLENISAIMNGKYLDANMSVRNNGLKDSENFKINIYADEKLVKEIPVNGLKIGYGTVIILNNLFVSQISIDELKFEIEYTSQELNKENNKFSMFPS